MEPSVPTAIRALHVRDSGGYSQLTRYNPRLKSHRGMGFGFVAETKARIETVITQDGAPEHCAIKDRCTSWRCRGLFLPDTFRRSWRSCREHLPASPHRACPQDESSRGTRRRALP